MEGIKVENAPIQTEKPKNSEEIPKSAEQHDSKLHIAIYEEIESFLLKISRATKALEKPDYDILDPGKIKQHTALLEKIYLHTYDLKFIQAADTEKLKDLEKLPELGQRFPFEVTKFEHLVSEKYSPVFEKLNTGEDLIENPYIILLSYLASAQDKDVSRTAGNFLVKILEIQARTKVKDPSAYPVILAVNNLLGREAIISGKRVKELFDELIEKKAIDFPQTCVVISALTNLKPESHEFAKFYIKSFLERYGLSYKKLGRAWRANASPGEFEEDGKQKKITQEEADDQLRMVVLMNLLRIRTIEMYHQGISKFLHDNYGINNFGRFSPETWLEQYENREKQEPYVLVVAARNDWNSSSYEEGIYRTYDNLRGKIKPTHRLRIVEVESLPNLARSLAQMQKKYGQPAFVIWSGHGSDTEFFLGPSLHRPKNYKFVIGPKDFKGGAKERMAKYLKMFSPETIMIMDACSSSNPDNLPEVVAKEIGNKIIYPKGKTQIADFGVERDSQGNLSFNVSYHWDIKTGTADGHISRTI